MHLLRNSAKPDFFEKWVAFYAPPEIPSHSITLHFPDDTNDPIKSHSDLKNCLYPENHFFVPVQVDEAAPMLSPENSHDCHPPHCPICHLKPYCFRSRCDFSI